MRPEPVVFLRLAFSPQLTVCKQKFVSFHHSLHLQAVLDVVSNHPLQARETPLYRSRGKIRTLAGLSGRVTAVGTGRLLDVEGAFACKSE